MINHYLFFIFYSFIMQYILYNSLLIIFTTTTTTIFYLDYINGVPSLTFEHTWLGCNTSLHSLAGSHALVH